MTQHDPTGHALGPARPAVPGFARWWLPILAVATLAIGPEASAQVRADPGVVINGRVAVRVYVTLSDDETPYHPVGGLMLRFLRSTGDSVSLWTDDAGAATALLVPGEYRVFSPAPAEWKGARWSWSVPVAVRAGLAAVELDARSADRELIPVVTPPADSGVGRASGPAARAAGPAVSAPRTNGPAPTVNPAAGSSNAGARPAPPPRVADAKFVSKDPSRATLYGMLAPGAGQMYAGERAKGIMLLLLSVGGFGVMYDAVSSMGESCGLKECDSSSSAGAVAGVGAVLWAGGWIYGIIDAGDAARRHNARGGAISVDAGRGISLRLSFR